MLLMLAHIHAIMIESVIENGQEEIVCASFQQEL